MARRIRAKDHRGQDGLKVGRYMVPSPPAYVAYLGMAGFSIQGRCCNRSSSHPSPLRCSSLIAVDGASLGGLGSTLQMKQLGEAESLTGIPLLNLPNASAHDQRHNQGTQAYRLETGRTYRTGCRILLCWDRWLPAWFCTPHSKVLSRSRCRFGYFPFHHAGSNHGTAPLIQKNPPACLG